jgi:hypothetical protein
MILNNGHSTKFLTDYRDGKIPFGLKLGCRLDEYFVYKHNHLNIFLGHDNVGKTYFQLWYFLALATNHGLSFCLFCDENSAGRIMRDLVQMYCNKKFMDLTHAEIRRAEMKIEHHFKFIDNSKRYEPKQIIDLYLGTQATTLLIDPWNSLKTDLTYTSNYEVLNDLKMVTKEGQHTIFINAHPTSASGRLGAVYPKDHFWSGQVRIPFKSDIEGGKAFSNKADDFIVIHRLISHADMWHFTMVEVAKVKDTDTGGKPTITEQPVMLDYNFGLGLTCDGVDVIKRPDAFKTKHIPEQPKQDLNKFRNINFDIENDVIQDDSEELDVWDTIKTP